jgi:hydrogenase small subunit
MGPGEVASFLGGELREMFARAIDGDVRILWLQGASDSGCTISLLQNVSPELMDLIIGFRRAVDFYPTLMGPSSDRALLSLTHALAGKTPLDLLVIEGDASAKGLCSAGGGTGRLVPFETWVKDLAAAAKTIVTVGTCAAAAGLTDGARVMSVPGCPADAGQLLLTLAAALSNSGQRPWPEAGPRSILRIRS